MNSRNARRWIWKIGVVMGCGLLIVSCSSPPPAQDAGLPSGQAAPAPSISPVAVIHVEPQGPVPAGTVIQFSAQASDPGIAESDAYEIRYLWAFGDGTMAAGRTVTHRYAGQGAYTVSLALEVIDASRAFFRDTAVTSVAMTEPVTPPSTTRFCPVT